MSFFGILILIGIVGLIFGRIGRRHRPFGFWGHRPPHPPPPRGFGWNSRDPGGPGGGFGNPGRGPGGPGGGPGRPR